MRLGGGLVGFSNSEFSLWADDRGGLFANRSVIIFRVLLVVRKWLFDG